MSAGSSCGSVRIDGLILGGPCRKGTSDCADKVTRSLSSTRTKGERALDASAKSPAELERELETRTRELAEAREHLAEALARETATSEVLQVISSSPGGLEPVFESMLANATRICEASYGVMFLCEGDHHSAPLRSTVSWPRLSSNSGKGEHLFRPDPELPALRAVRN